MAETFCGKSCELCTDRVTLDCPGCKDGPGQRYYGDCQLAQCAMRKGHDHCNACLYREGCATLKDQDRMPQRRHEFRKTRAEFLRRAPILGKWLTILFWLIIPSTIASLMTNDSIVQTLPVLQTPGHLLSAAVTAAYGLILLKLSPIEYRYRSAGICTLITCAFDLLALLLSLTGQSPGGVILLSLPSLFLSIIALYHEFAGHSQVLSGTDDELAVRWEKLFKWMLMAQAATLVSVIFSAAGSLFGALLMLASSIGVFATGILKLVYLYRTAEIFRLYS